MGFNVRKRYPLNGKGKSVEACENWKGAEGYDYCRSGEELGHTHACFQVDVTSCRVWQ